GLCTQAQRGRRRGDRNSLQRDDPRFRPAKRHSRPPGPAGRPTTSKRRNPRRIEAVSCYEMRRLRLKFIVALGAAVAALLAQAASPASWTAQQAPGFYRLKLREFRITVVSVGTAGRHPPQ